MIKIKHRINTLELLQEVPSKYGAEIDVRYHNNDLILAHDPFNHQINELVKFEDFLKNYHLQGPLILNVKTEGIEQTCIDLMNKYAITNWFFLDLSMPYFVIYANRAKNNEIKGFSADNLAVRFSEFEPIEYALSFIGKARWVWIDFFTHTPLNKDNYKLLKDAGFKLCLVSPELQRHPIDKINEFKSLLEDLEIYSEIDAVCTKRAELW